MSEWGKDFVCQKTACVRKWAVLRHILSGNYGDCDIFLMFIAPGCFCVHGEGEDIKHFSVYIKNHHMPEHFSDVISDTKTICILILKCGDGICKVMFYFRGCKKKFHM